MSNHKMKLSVIILLFLFSTSVSSHSGRTNSEGCHNDNVGGTGYHCHNTGSPPPSIPTVPTQPTVPDPEPTPINYPVASQNAQTLRGAFPEFPSNYISNTANLQCVITSEGAYNVGLALSNNGFCITASELSAECAEYSGKFSFLTRVLTIFDINVDATNYQAGLELNSSGCFNLFYARLKAENHQVFAEYDRDLWSGWIDEDGDCSDTRDEVLKIFNQNANTNESCDLSAGLWLDPYTAVEFTSASDLDIDHIVPISFAHEHGAANWSSALKQQFYNDTENLLPVSASANRSKGDKSPIDWMPENTDYHCTYVDSFLYIVDKYHLDLTDIEREGIQKRCIN